MNHSKTLFRIFGIDVKLHYSWWFIFILLMWSLAIAFFPQQFPGYSSTEYWVMGVVAAIFLFISVLFHELSHSLVARSKNIKVESITLFFFGGVAGITREDMKPKHEFIMAIAGPLFSLCLAGVFYLLFVFIPQGLWTPILYYLALINFILGLFNLVPGFPLDGGRAFRAVLNMYYKDLKKATRIAALGGRIFAGYMIIEGVLNLFGVVILLPGGIWFILLGGFLYFIAGVSYEQVIIKEVLQKIPLTKVLKKSALVLSPSMKFSQFVTQYAGTEENVFLVEGKNFKGILDLQKVGRILPTMQESITLRQLAIPLSELKVLSIKNSAYTAFHLFSELGVNGLPVMEGKKQLGICTRQAVMNQLLWRLKYDVK